jgi:hypothetical protein
VSGCQLQRTAGLYTSQGAAGIELNYEEPGDTFILVPDEKDEVKPKPFSSCTVDDMRAALLHLRQSDSSTPIPAEQRALVDQYRRCSTRRKHRRVNNGPRSRRLGARGRLFQAPPRAPATAAPKWQAAQAPSSASNTVSSTHRRETRTEVLRLTGLPSSHH